MTQTITTTLHLPQDIDAALSVIAEELSLDKPSLMRMVLTRFARSHGAVGTDPSQLGMKKVELLACLNEITRNNNDLQNDASAKKQPYLMVTPDDHTYRITIEKVL